MLVFATLPLPQSLARYFIAAWGLSVLIGYAFRYKEFSTYADLSYFIKPGDIRFLMIAYWLICAISALWAVDKTLVSIRLEIKLMFLLAPIFFSLTHFSVKWIKRMLLAFIIGNLAALAFNLGSSIASFQESEKVSEFIMKQFSEWVHPSYWGMYLVFAIMICAYFIIWKSIKGSRNIGLFMSISAFFATAVLLVQSKNAILAMFFIPVVLIIWFIVRNGKWKKGISVLIILLISVGLSFYLTPNLQKRFANVYDSLTDTTIQVDSKESTDSRIVAWNASLELIKKNPWLGYGIGQEKDNLVQIYEREGMSEAVRMRLDAHSQFLFSWISSGLVGFLSLLSMFISLIYHGYKKRSGLIILFSFLVFFSCLTESMFEAQSGVLFFVFFALLLRSMPDGRKQSA